MGRSSSLFLTSSISSIACFSPTIFTAPTTCPITDCVHVSRIATVTSTAVLFAKTELHMEPASLAFMSVIGTAFGIAGAFLWPFISRLPGLNLTPPRTVLLCVSLMACVPAYG